MGSYVVFAAGLISGVVVLFLVLLLARWRSACASDGGDDSCFHDDYFDRRRALKHAVAQGAGDSGPAVVARARSYLAFLTEEPKEENG